MMDSVWAAAQDPQNGGSWTTLATFSFGVAAYFWFRRIAEEAKSAGTPYAKAALWPAVVWLTFFVLCVVTIHLAGFPAEALLVPAILIWPIVLIRLHEREQD